MEVELDNENIRNLFKSMVRLLKNKSERLQDLKALVMNLI
jgi:hypothetical protein